METIVWKKIPTLPLWYEAGSNGMIRRISHIITRAMNGKAVLQPMAEKIMGNGINPKGYNNVRLLNKTYRTHRLIALAFIQNPSGAPQINHKNGIKTDNRPCNLEWVTNQQNRTHAVSNGLHAIGSMRSKTLSENDVLIIRSLRESKIKYKHIALAFGVTKECIGQICRRETWRHI